MDEAALLLTDRVRNNIQLGESYIREFKSALEGAPHNKKPRQVKEILREIGEQLVGFANFEGGDLLIDVEDDGKITGVPHDEEAVLGSGKPSTMVRITPVKRPSRKLGDAAWEQATSPCCRLEQTPLLKDRHESLVGLDLQNKAQTFINEALQPRRQRARVLGQETMVEGQELRDIHNRIAREARRERRQQDITGQIGKFQVAGDHGHDCSLNAAAVERVCLDHKHRPPISRLGTARFGEIGPPDLSPLNPVHRYQESFSRDLSWARCNARSTVAGRREYTSFRRSVTALPCCRFRNSEIAVAYN